jgi:PAS domain S-box-containing protein
MPTPTIAEPQQPPLATIDLGIAGWRIPLHSHVACLWESEAHLATAVSFVEAGLRGSDHCLVVGSAADNRRVTGILAQRGLDIAAGERCGRLVVIERAFSAAAMDRDITSALASAVAAGAGIIRLFSIIGWDRPGEAPDAELFAWESRHAPVAGAWPCVILCLHELRPPSGPQLSHGVLATHHHLLKAVGVLANPIFVPLERSPQRIAAIVTDLSGRQQQWQALRKRSELLQAIFDKAPVMISLFDPAGRLLLANPEWERVLGWRVEEAQRSDVMAEVYPDPAYRRRALEFIQGAENHWADFSMRTRESRVIEVSSGRTTLSDGTRLVFGRNVTERKLAEERLRQSYDELRALSERLRAAREEESARMAREVHDEVGQMLTALRLDVAWLERQLPLPAQPVGEEIRVKLRAMAQLLDSAADAVHRIASELRPGILDKLGLEAAVEWYVGEFERRTGISCRLTSSLGGEALDPDHATALFRILQEALTNVARHAAASAVEICLAAKAGRVLLAVADNGRGIPADKAADARSLGLIGMRERAQALGGDAVIRRDPAGGTAVEVSLPR